MTDVGGDRRISKRRKMTRRMFDMLHGKAPDCLVWTRYLGVDRRQHVRRSDGDRRADGA